MSGLRPDEGWRAWLLGTRDRLGWWLLPMFLMVGLGGAVLAGSLVVVYYAQQVNELRTETREAREELVGAADDVRDEADDAIAAIDEEATSVREELGLGLPMENALDNGVVRLEVDTELQPTGGAEPEQSSADEDERGRDADTTTGSSPGEPIPLRRAGSGFVVVVDGGTAYLVTSLGLLDDPRTEDHVPADVEVSVRLPAGSTTATVHSWDGDNDLLLLRADIGNVEPLPWRPQGEDLEPGDRVVAVGATPDLEVVRMRAEVAGVSQAALVTSLPSLRLVAGGPVVDLDGNVLGVASAGHGALGGDPLVVPVRRLCDDLLTSCPD